MRDYDPALFELLHWAFGDDDWYPECPKYPRAPLAGRGCDRQFSGEDVLSFALPLETDGGSVSGTVHLPEALTEAREVRFRVHGLSDDLDVVSFLLQTGRYLAAGTQDFRYTITNIPPGQYLPTAALDPEGEGDFAPESVWIGGHNGVGESDSSDRVSVGESPRCDVDLTLYKPEDLEQNPDPARTK